MLFSKLASIFSIVASRADESWPAPGACKGGCYARDPSVAKKGDTYYRFTTHNLIGIQTAPAISGPWTQIGSVVENSSVIAMDGNADLWAPDVRLINGVWFCLYSVSTLGSQHSAVGYATSPDLDPGSWTDHGAIVTSASGDKFNAIDGNLYKGPGAAEWYLQWGSYHEGIFSDAATISGNKLSRAAAAQQLAFYPPTNHPQEGSFMYHHGSFYYEFISRGKAGTFGDDPASYPLEDAYHVVVCRAANPRGSFVDKNGKACKDGGGTVVYYSNGNTFAPGGQGVLNDGSRDIFYYHYMDRTIGYENTDTQFGWNVLDWSSGWPVAK